MHIWFDTFFDIVADISIDIGIDFFFFLIFLLTFITDIFDNFVLVYIFLNWWYFDIYSLIRLIYFESGDLPD